jgi:hypothetical protein
VGDAVTYPNGSKAFIVDGVVPGVALYGQSYAMIGSRLDNGDHIINSRQSRFCLLELHGEPTSGVSAPIYIVRRISSSK